MHLLCKLSPKFFCALHTIEQTEYKPYFRFTARWRLRLPRGCTALIWQPLLHCLHCRLSVAESTQLRQQPQVPWPEMLPPSS